MNKKLNIIMLASMLFLAGCATSTPTVPKNDYPALWETQNAFDNNFFKQDNWWLVYNDSELNSFMETVLQQNSDLKQYLLNTKRASLSADLQRTSYIPSFSGSLDTRASKSEGGSLIKSSGANLSVSYEADIWGRIQKQVGNAEIEVQATQEDLEALRLSIAYQAVSLYYNHIYLAESSRYSQQSVEYYTELKRILQARFDYGVISKLELMQAEQSLLNQQNLLLSLDAQQKENTNAIKNLTDIDITTLSPNITKTQLSKFEFDNIPSGIPVSVLKSRPDVRAAEYRLGAALQNIDIVKVSYLPGLTLTGSLGTSSSSLGQLLSNPIATLGAGLVLPFLNGAEKAANIGIAKVDYETSIINLRRTFYTALTETDNALTNYNKQKSQLENLEKITSLSAEIVQLNKKKYEVGVIGFKEYLDSQESERQANLNLIRAKYDLILHRANIAKSMGGNFIQTLK